MGGRGTPRPYNGLHSFQCCGAGCSARETYTGDIDDKYRIVGAGDVLFVSEPGF